MPHLPSSRLTRHRRIRTIAVSVGLAVGALVSTLGSQLAHAEATMRPVLPAFSWPWSAPEAVHIDRSPEWPAPAADEAGTPHPSGA